MEYRVYWFDSYGHWHSAQEYDCWSLDAAIEDAQSIVSHAGERCAVVKDSWGHIVHVARRPGPDTQ